MAEKNGLSARELLEGVYGVLKSGGKEVKLPSMALAEIANDSDWHRTRIGYTSYESAILLEAGGKEWAVALGFKCGDYPADPYNCDIAAVELSGDKKPNKQKASEAYDALVKNRYFHKSLIYAMADGQLAVSEGGLFSRKVCDLLSRATEGSIAQRLKTDPQYFTMGLRPVVTSDVRYNPEFVVFLSSVLRTVLASSFAS